MRGLVRRGGPLRSRGAGKPERREAEGERRRGAAEDRKDKGSQGAGRKGCGAAAFVAQGALAVRRSLRGERGRGWGSEGVREGGGADGGGDAREGEGERDDCENGKNDIEEGGNFSLFFPERAPRRGRGPAEGGARKASRGGRLGAGLAPQGPGADAGKGEKRKERGVFFNF